LSVAVVFAVVFVAVGVSVLLPRGAARVGVVMAVVAAVLIWVVGENFGLLFPGGATDPNSGPLLVLLALTYWPLRPRPAESGSAMAVVTTEQPLAVKAR
jgi:lipopolysaccharide export LptBFGC system permease protein LptF